jgi:hypothetical protein
VTKPLIRFAVLVANRDLTRLPVPVVLREFLDQERAERFARSECVARNRHVWVERWFSVGMFTRSRIRREFGEVPERIVAKFRPMLAKGA